MTVSSSSDPDRFMWTGHWTQLQRLRWWGHTPPPLTHSDQLMMFTGLLLKTKGVIISLNSRDTTSLHCCSCAKQIRVPVQSETSHNSRTELQIRMNWTAEAERSPGSGEAGPGQWSVRIWTKTISTGGVLSVYTTGVNMRPTGQKRPTAGSNPVRGMNVWNVINKMN